MKKQLLLILLALSCFTGFAQGKLAGKVTDLNSGEMLTGVTVKIIGTAQKVITDQDGNFVFHSLKPGVYEIEVNYISYETEIKTIQLKEGSNGHINFELKPVETSIFKESEASTLRQLISYVDSPQSTLNIPE